MSLGGGGGGEEEKKVCVSGGGGGGRRGDFTVSRKLNDLLFFSTRLRSFRRG